MSAEGIFHDAHEVYARSGEGQPWTWLATFASSSLAINYALSSAIPEGADTEVRPV